MVSVNRFISQIFAICIFYGVSFPLLSIALVDMNAPTQMIGAIAAMPALGWLLGTPMIPFALRFLTLHQLMIGLLGVANLAWWGFWSIESPEMWLVLRFLFGGALGLFFRCAEYTLTATAPEAKRGRWLGRYNFAFMGGILCGTVLMPYLGSGSVGFGFVAFGMAIVLLMGIIWPVVPHILDSVSWNPSKIALFAKAVPISAAAILLYAVYEDLSVAMLPVYAMQQGMGEVLAANAVTAVIFGALLGPLIGGVIVDSYGALRMIGMASLLGGIFMVISATVDVTNTSTFLMLMVVDGAVFSAIYVAGLAHLGSKFKGEDLLHANVGFGTVYAIGALIGPIYNAQMMHIFPKDGLFLGVAALSLAVFLIFVLMPRRV